MSNMAETVENLLLEYSNSLEYSFKERGRHLRCSFCNRKYQMVLNQHAIEKHLVNLKNLTNEEQKRLILEFLRSDPEILPRLGISRLSSKIFLWRKVTSRYTLVQF